MTFFLVFNCSLFKFYIITHIIFVNLFNIYYTFIIKFVYYNVSDISLLSNLTNLETLKLDGNNIEHLYPLADLKKLKTLTLSSNNISSIIVLANLIKLEVLDLSDNKILDLSPLSGIKDKLGKDGKFDYQVIELDPVQAKDNQVIMKIPKVYDINGTLIKEPSEFSDGIDHEVIGDTVIWKNVKEGSTLKIVFESKNTPFEVTIRQRVIKPQTNISITDI